MSAFADLECYPSLMRQENIKYLEDDSDAALIALNQEAALAELESAIISVRGLRGSTSDVTEVLDDLATNYSNSLRFALTYQQLIIYYDNYIDVEGSYSWQRAQHYKSLFDRFVLRAQKLQLSAELDPEDTDSSISYSYNIG